MQPPRMFKQYPLLSLQEPGVGVELAMRSASVLNAHHLGAWEAVNAQIAWRIYHEGSQRWLSADRSTQLSAHAALNSVRASLAVV